MKTLTKADIADVIFKQVGLAKTDSVKLISTLLEHISTALKHDEKVKVGGFGTFEVRQKKQRIGRNPKTGQEAVISSRKVISFKTSAMFRDRLNQA